MKINEVLKKYDLVAQKYEKKDSVLIVNTNNGKYVYKEKEPNNKIYNYLKSRNFDYLPVFVSNSNDKYQLMEYLDEFDIPKEQKILDMVSLVSLLHSKTTHYKEIDYNDYEQLYDDLNNNIEYLNGYYNDLINIIETKVYMSPSEYLIARNITTIFNSINLAKERLDEWYQLVKEKRKQRNVVLHNNLKLDHFIKNKHSYLISWDKSKIGSPVFDLYKLYNNHALDFDFAEVLKKYESNYPLLKEEKALFFTLITLPRIIKLNAKEYDMCKQISKDIDTIFKTEDFTKTT